MDFPYKREGTILEFQGVELKELTKERVPSLTWKREREKG